MKRFLAATLALLAAACATTPISSPIAPTGPVSIPSGAFDLGGDWRHDTAAAVVTHFEQSASARYGAGLALADVTADLRHNQFACTANHDPGVRGDPPAQICRKTVSEAGCTHTWQVHLFDTHGDARLGRTRGLYDRRCGNDTLLGGPS